MNLWQALGLYILMIIGITVFMVLSVGCTHGGSDGSRISHQPAVILCFLANCETELADRTAAPLDQDESTELEITPVP